MNLHIGNFHMSNCECAYCKYSTIENVNILIIIYSYIDIYIARTSTVHVCLSVCLPVLYMSVCLSTYLYCTCMSVCLPTCIVHVCLSVYLPVLYMYMCLSVYYYLCVCPTCTCICLYACLPVCLFLSLFLSFSSFIHIKVLLTDLFF